VEQPYSEVRKRIGLTIGKKFSRWSRRTGCIFGEKGNGSDFEKTGIGNFWVLGLIGTGVKVGEQWGNGEAGKGTKKSERWVKGCEGGFGQKPEVKGLRGVR